MVSLLMRIDHKTYLVTTVILEVAILASDSVERLQNLSVEFTGWELLRLVAHEPVNEAPRSRLSNHTGERSEEAVRVFILTLLGTGKAAVREQLQVIVVLRLTKVIQLLE